MLKPLEQATPSRSHSIQHNGFRINMLRQSQNLSVANKQSTSSIFIKPPEIDNVDDYQNDKTESPVVFKR